MNVEPELLHTYSKVYKNDLILLIVRLAVLTAVTLTVPVVLFPVSLTLTHTHTHTHTRTQTQTHTNRHTVVNSYVLPIPSAGGDVVPFTLGQLQFTVYC